MISSGPVEDRLAIRELVESYNDAVMRFDADAWAANWVEDGTWTLPGIGPVTGRAAIVAVWRQAMSAFSFVGFFASAGPIVVDGDHAHGTCISGNFCIRKTVRSASSPAAMKTTMCGAAVAGISTSVFTQC